MEKNGMERFRLPLFVRSMSANLFDVNEPTSTLLDGMASVRAHTQKEFKKEKQQEKNNTTLFFRY